VEPENVEELCFALKDMCAHYDKFNKATIREFAVDNYGSEKFKKTMTAIYTSILS
jgi:hypothetical protein